MPTLRRANDNDHRPIEVEVVEVRDAPGHWLVEAIDHGSEGEVYRATFDGSKAKERAESYARLTYGWPANHARAEVAVAGPQLAAGPSGEDDIR
jgi:hypothetical protein